MHMEKPTMELIEFEADDVIVTSGGSDHPSMETCNGPDSPSDNCGDFME